MVLKYSGVTLLCPILLLCVVNPDGVATTEDPGWPVCPLEAGVRCQPHELGKLREYVYSVEGETVTMEFAAGAYFSVQCGDKVTLESPSLPRFAAMQRVADVIVRRCPPPAGSYAAALARLNVTAVAKLTLDRLPAPAALRREHFAGAASLAGLVVQLGVSGAVAPEAGFLGELAGLRTLRLDAVPLRPGEVERLPAGLEYLHLVRTGAGLVSAAALARLARLRVLVVRDVRPAALELGGAGAGALREVTLDAPGAAAAAAPGLRSAVVWRWAASAPEPWGPCEELETLELVLAEARALPARWLARCPAVRAVAVRFARHLRELPPRLLEGAAGLRSFNFTSSQLATLPAGFFDDAPGLRSINISGNKLLTLPSELFLRTRRLENLDMSKNKLSGDAVALLSTLTSLRRLMLGGNALGDQCGGAGSLVTARGSSRLYQLERLEELSLRRAGLSRVCSDWRASLRRLRRLDLSDNNITRLAYDDLQYRREIAGATVDLTGNPVETVQYEYEDYNIVLGETDEDSQATVTLDSSLRCECGAYWTALALRARPTHVDVRGLRCGAVGEGRAGAGAGAGGPLALVPPEELVCAAEGGQGGQGTEACPAGCTCWWRPRAPPHAPPAAVHRVRCDHAALRAAPPLQPLSPAGLHARELLLRGNRIHLRAEDVPPDLLVLDLRDNNLSDVSAATARRLLEGTASRVLLAGNPLECQCGELVPRLRLHAARVDWAALACADPPGAPLDAAPSAAECERRARLRLGLALGGALVPLALAGAALAAWLLHAELRLRVKAALAARGWLPGWGGGGREGEGAGCRYDAFVSYSHRDEARVRQLAARLERAGYRLCLHYRDWAPGQWIPAQIAASVRASRRTLALVSEHFLASTWARAEFREAHAAALREARPTLVVVLLDRLPPAALCPHPELRAFLDANTYVEWSDPWFWEKLLYAMPKLSRRRRREAAATPAPAPDPATTPTPAPDPPATPTPTPAPTPAATSAAA